ncbi:MAG TPA: 23S rRNA (adenine(2030)-N(6))-methyltransferase RlmJ [Steroidobacteraceae bacterium]|nr:23S rRNA (adenine(2030)-N(6))-methyltransferase RlmJ [Steroidobacteraceae bacterium]
MKYRHEHHAGNFADVHKHVTLLALLAALKRKDKGFLYLETHAGRGAYELSGAAAESANGIGRLELQRSAAGAEPAAAEEIGHYAARVAQLRTERRQPRLYPGSPLLAVSELRPQDRAVFVEVLPAEARALERALSGQAQGRGGAFQRSTASLRRAGVHGGTPRACAKQDSVAQCDRPPQVAGSRAKTTLFARDGAGPGRSPDPALHITVESGDGFERMRAWLPPQERRGLTFIDPPYEESRQDFDRARHAAAEALRRFQTGVVAIWYPIKDERDTSAWHAALAAELDCGLLAAELALYPRDSRVALNGSGMLILNPPYQLAERMETWLPQLHRCLDLGHGGGTSVRHLA